MIFSLALLSLIATPLDVKVLLGNKPLPNHPIEFYQFKNGDEHTSLQKKTNASGQIRFDVNTKEDTQILFRVIYKDLQYLSDPYFSQALPKEGITIHVYETISEVPDLFIEDLRLFISATNREELKIDQEVLVQNNSNFSVVGRESKQDAEVLRLSIPESAHDLRFTNGFSQEDTKFEGSDIISSRPLLPGSSTYGLKYAIERGLKSAELDIKTSASVKQISVSSDIKGLKLSQLGFTQGAPKYLNGQLIPTWFAPVKDLKDISFKIKGLPIKYREAHLVFAIAILLFIAILFVLLRQKDESSDKDKTAILKDLILLQRMKERGLISEEEYGQRRLQSLVKLQSFYS